jgi:hypothetical protein
VKAQATGIEGEDRPAGMDLSGRAQTVLQAQKSQGSGEDPAPGPLSKAEQKTRLKDAIFPLSEAEYSVSQNGT